jgi:hypothetical protein
LLRLKGLVSVVLSSPIALLVSAIIAAVIVVFGFLWLMNATPKVISNDPAVVFSDEFSQLESLVKDNVETGVCRIDAFNKLTQGDTKCLSDSCAGGAILTEQDMEIAKIAWKYFENNYNPKTGLYNSNDKYPSTTMWDTGSALAAMIAANEFGLIDDREFDERVYAMFKTLNKMKLFNNEAPNKVYHTQTGEMVNYLNKPSEFGIGVSTLDLARMMSWLNILTCQHPKYLNAALSSVGRWDLSRLVTNEQMYGLARDPSTKKTRTLQEGRLGYEQYAGKIFANSGFSQNISATYHNEYFGSVKIYGVDIAYDTRDPRDLGAYNYVVTESYIMDVLENGVDAENRILMDNIFEVQKRRWQKTGIITAVSEDNIDQKPYFLYNTIFVAGKPWNTITDRGKDYHHLKTTSVKAALSMAAMYPDDPYSKVLYDAVKYANNPERGWYSGIYESGLGYNKAITANTNGIILSLLLNKRYGEFSRVCKRCGDLFSKGLVSVYPEQITQQNIAKDNLADAE